MAGMVTNGPPRRWASVVAQQPKRRRQPLGQQHLEDVVDGDHADHLLLGVDDRRRPQVKSAISRATSSSSHRRRGAGSTRHELRDGRNGIGADERRDGTEPSSGGPCPSRDVGQQLVTDVATADALQRLGHVAWR